MHNVQNVCGCIGHLMKESGLETLIGAAFGAQQHHGARETMRPCNASMQDGSNASILLQSFLETDFKSWKQICEYLEKARLHPTGRHWVDNLITPTQLAHQLLRSEREGYYIVILLHSWSPPLCQIYLVALPRDVCPAWWSYGWCFRTSLASVLTLWRLTMMTGTIYLMAK